MKEYDFTPDEKALYLGCARMGLAGAGDDEVLNYVKNVKRMQETDNDGCKTVSIEPDKALLISMATCLNHGFGLMGFRQQQLILNDMKKIHAEVVGLGYYTPENRDRYISMIMTEPDDSEIVNSEDPIRSIINQEQEK